MGYTVNSIIIKKEMNELLEIGRNYITIKM